MKRRTVLGGLVSGAGMLTGCLASSGGTTSTPSGKNTATYSGPKREQALKGAFTTGEVQRRVSLVRVDSVPDDLAIIIEADLLEREVTGNHTARLQVTTINQGSERFISIDNGGCSLFNRDSGESEDGALWLIQPEFPGMRFYGDGDPRTEPLWAVRHDDDGPPPGIIFQGYGCGSYRYGSGESVTNEYRLWDSWRGPGYMPPGVHRFEEQVEVSAVRDSPGEDESSRGETLATFTWGLELRVENPGE